MPTRRQTRSATMEADMQQADSMSRMADMFEQLLARQNNNRETFKPPIFKGKGDVELFINRFMEVAQANQWPDPATLLHLKECIQDEANVCARYTSIDSVIAALRSRYGMTIREARTKLTSLKRDPKTSLQQHGIEVERLINVAHPELPESYRTEMMIDTFCTTIGNGYLQRHLLTVNTPTLEDAIKAGNEYLQIPVGNNRQYSSTSVVHTNVDSIIEENVQKSADTELTKILKMLETMNGRIEKLEKPRNKDNRSNINKNEISCYKCGHKGHIQRFCPTSNMSKQAQQKTENSQGPQ